MLYPHSSCAPDRQDEVAADMSIKSKKTAVFFFQDKAVLLLLLLFFLFVLAFNSFLVNLVDVLNDGLLSS